jgi:hypothetical protein
MFETEGYSFYSAESLGFPFDEPAIFGWIKRRRGPLIALNGPLTWVADHDPVGDEGDEYAVKLKAANVAVDHRSGFSGPAGVCLNFFAVARRG